MNRGKLRCRKILEYRRGISESSSRIKREELVFYLVKSSYLEIVGSCIFRLVRKESRASFSYKSFLIREIANKLVPAEILKQDERT